MATISNCREMTRGAKAYVIEIQMAARTRGRARQYTPPLPLSGWI